MRAKNWPGSRYAGTGFATGAAAEAELDFSVLPALADGTVLTGVALTVEADFAAGPDFSAGTGFAAGAGFADCMTELLDLLLVVELFAVFMAGTVTSGTLTVLVTIVDTAGWVSVMGAGAGDTWNASTAGLTGTRGVWGVRGVSGALSSTPRCELEADEADKRRWLDGFTGTTTT